MFSLCTYIFCSSLVCSTTITVACPRAQAAGGHGPEKKQRVDWMYEGPMQSTVDQQAEANEYLMGKEVTRAGRRVVCSAMI